MTQNTFEDPTRFIALATDYDGTIAQNGRVDPSTLYALRRAQRAGLRLILVTGRILEDLLRVFAHTELFDRIVTENGAVVVDPTHGAPRILAPPPPPELLRVLAAENVPVTVGRSIVATTEPHDRVLLRAIRALELDWHISFNKDSAMALPWDVTKATGLTSALDELQVPPSRTIGIGDAENDLPFLRVCGMAVAVGNALPAVKEATDLVTAAAGGEGVSEFVNQLVDELQG
jgi:hydroxymethylpyrimidine pyrophosphatase-like HAD family hydrolase